MSSPGEDVQVWSTTAINNSGGTTGGDPLINWAEGQPRASVNNSARSMLAAHAKDRNLKNGSITTGGTANAQTFTSGVGYTTVPTGLTVRLNVGVTNTGATTLNMDGIGAVAVKDQTGGDLGRDALTIGRYAEFIYNGTNWILLQGNTTGSAPQSGRLSYLSPVALSFNPYNGDTIKVNGAIYPINAFGTPGLANTSIRVSGAVGNLAPDTTYGVYVEIVGGVLTGSFWPYPSVTHVPSTTTGNVGVEVAFSGGVVDTLTLIGLVRTNAAGQFQSDGAYRGVISWFNRRDLYLLGPRNTISTASTSIVEAHSGSRINLLMWGDETLLINLSGNAANSAAGNDLQNTIGIDNVSMGNNTIIHAVIAGYQGAMAWAMSGSIAEGWHYFTPMVQTSGGVGTFSLFASGIMRG